MASTNTYYTDVSDDTYNSLYLFAQYSAAAYCSSNIDATTSGDAVTCSAGNCPEVQSATTKTLYEFDE